MTACRGPEEQGTPPHSARSIETATFYLLRFGASPRHSKGRIAPLTLVEQACCRLCTPFDALFYSQRMKPRRP